jgi:transposase
MATPGKKRILNYGLEFKLRAVQLSNQHGVLVKDVAESLDIHPFMLSISSPRAGVTASSSTRASLVG